MKRRILLADDDSSVRQTVARVLELEGYDVTLARSGGEAVAKVLFDPPDLVLLEVNLPGQSGWDTLERLAAVFPLLPVIITASPNQQFSPLAAIAGAVLQKPLDFPELLSTIGQLLAEPRRSRLARTSRQAGDFDPLSHDARTDFIAVP